MKSVFFVAAIFFSMAISAQVKRVSIQASGLTCSMCSNAINKSLRSVGFVEDVKPDIKRSTFDITFKNGRAVDFEVLKNKVEDAGFFVSKFVATFYFNNVQIKANQPVVIGDITFHFINTGDQVLVGEKAIQIIDKGFVPAKQYKKNSFPSLPSNAGQAYHVTI